MAGGGGVKAGKRPWETNGQGGRNERTAAEENRERPGVRDW